MSEEGEHNSSHTVLIVIPKENKFGRVDAKMKYIYLYKKCKIIQCVDYFWTSWSMKVAKLSYR